MSLLDDAISDGPDLWFETDDLAQSGTYKVGGYGNGSTVAVLVVSGGTPGAERNPINTGLRSRYLAEELTALLQVADVAAPKEGDTLTLGSDLWTVRDVEAGNGVVWQLKLVKNIRASHG